MLPPEFAERLKNQPYLDVESLIKALGEPTPVSIYTNPAKWGKTPAGHQRVSWCRNGFYFESRPSYTLDPLFHSGCYYPREASGMFLQQVFDQFVNPVEKHNVLDLCAAPGGKSIQISDLMNTGSLLISNEVIRSRSLTLSETIAKWGKGNTIVTQNDPSAFNKFHGFFDIIFIDAPCSGEGMFRDKKAVEEWSPNNARLCEERQRRIISDIWPALKENGLLVYSTCTFNPGENEKNIKWMVEHHQAESLHIDVSTFTGITEIDYEGIHGYGFYPDKIRGEGFFISVIRKTAAQEVVSFRSHPGKIFRPGKTEISFAGNWMMTMDDKLMKRGDNLVALPCSYEDYIHIFSHLNIVRGGTQIATIKKNDYVPSHDLALSQYIIPGSFPSAEMDYHDALAYLRRDYLDIPGLQNGWNLLTFKGVNLGFVKNIGKRINNYFPVEWRIRMSKPGPGMENIIRWDNE